MRTLVRGNEKVFRNCEDPAFPGSLRRSGIPISWILALLYIFNRGGIEDLDGGAGGDKTPKNVTSCSHLGPSQKHLSLMRRPNDVLRRMMRGKKT